ncbi:MAG: hypothetical protein LBJ67_06330 [Planctomycetaceae bacterium]|nr:hypothetical protein [Planctomycetaceae bacterium]
MRTRATDCLFLLSLIFYLTPAYAFVVGSDGGGIMPATVCVWRSAFPYGSAIFLM